MSYHPSSTRSSIDASVRAERSTPLELSQRKNVRAHPPRLQHSPSLPNIWIPAHSHLSSLEIALDREPPRRPLTPVLPMSPSSRQGGAQSTSMCDSCPADTPEAKMQASAAPSTTELTPDSIARAHCRRLQNRHRDHSHTLLTPPLTPSSSIRTSASSESTGNNGFKQADELEASNATEEGNNDHECTRFLLLGNVNRQLPSGILRSAIVLALTKPLHMDKDPSNGPRDFRAEADIIKGVFIRCQETHGVVLLAFFDVRQAKAATSILSAPCNGPLAACVGTDISQDGSRAWLTCRFITIEELVQMIGHSQFLENTDGRFFISLQKVSEEAQSDNGCGSEVEQLVGSTAENGDQRKANAIRLKTVKPSLLRGVLQAYGEVRSITGIDENNGRADTDELIVEYFDIRDADMAFAALDKQVMFGIRIHVYRRELSQKKSQKLTSAKHNNIAFPSVSTGEDHDLNIGSPGEHSQIRQRFMFTDAAGRFRPRSISAGPQMSHTSPSLPPYLQISDDAPAPSPTYFYTSPSPESSNNVPLYPTPTRIASGPQSSGHKYANAPNIETNWNGSQDLERLPQQNDASDPSFYGHALENRSAHRTSGPQCYTPQQDCLYCPSRSCSSNASYGAVFSPHSTPSPPLIHYPIIHPSQHMQSPVVETNLSARGRLDHEAAFVQTPIHAGIPNWSLDQTMVVANNNAYGHPSTGFWVTEGQCLPTPSGPLFPASYLASAAPDPPVYPPFRDVQLEQNGHHIFVPNLSPTSPSPRSSALPANMSSNAGSSCPSSTTAERNELNIARIEEGQDTRTTVMIKNIPNKMSDKDLISYIGKVCPRRIDFLYLRMDFQNGCNVGYAFVNFIHVQDLLRFARKRLGEKWNMFSSEKVLQMSYATYQGKEALIEKFKNSSIMDERESWRPKIFYSSGPEQGLPEPFPSPTHFRRKERSSFNRGALFVTGVGGNSHSSHNGFGDRESPRRQQVPHNEQRTYASRHLERQQPRSRPLGNGAMQGMGRGGNGHLTSSRDIFT